MRKLFVMAVCAAVLSFSNLASAAVYSYKASAGPNASPDANSGAVNVWTVVASTGNASNAGSFQGDSGSNGDNTGAGAGSSAWALYANSGNNINATTNLATLIGAEGPIDLASESIQIAFDNGYIDNGASVSLEFLDSSSNIATRLRFTGGETTYKLDDSVSSFNTGVNFTDDGFSVLLTLSNGVGGYSFQIGGNSPLTGRTLAGGATAITSVRLVNNNAGGGGERNLFFDNLVINAIPEPGAFLFGGIATAFAGLAFRRRK